MRCTSKITRELYSTNQRLVAFERASQGSDSKLLPWGQRVQSHLRPVPLRMERLQGIVPRKRLLSGHWREQH